MDAGKRHPSLFLIHGSDQLFIPAGPEIGILGVRLHPLAGRVGAAGIRIQRGAIKDRGIGRNTLGFRRIGHDHGRTVKDGDIEGTRGGIPTGVERSTTDRGDTRRER